MKNYRPVYTHMNPASDWIVFFGLVSIAAIIYWIVNYFEISFFYCWFIWWSILASKDSVKRSITHIRVRQFTLIFFECIATSLIILAPYVPYYAFKYHGAFLYSNRAFSHGTPAQAQLGLLVVISSFVLPVLAVLVNHMIDKQMISKLESKSKPEVEQTN